MSAIQRDREIAAKAFQGVWSAEVRTGTAAGGVSINVDDGEEVYTEACWAGDLTDAEHIVRLHNRQPLYDALVDAAQRLYRERHVHNDDAFNNLMGALAALDREEP